MKLLHTTLLAASLNILSGCPAVIKSPSVKETTIPKTMHYISEALDGTAPKADEVRLMEALYTLGSWIQHGNVATSFEDALAQKAVDIVNYQSFIQKLAQQDQNAIKEETARIEAINTSLETRAISSELRTGNTYGIKFVKEIIEYESKRSVEEVQYDNRVRQENTKALVLYKQALKDEAALFGTADISNAPLKPLIDEELGEAQYAIRRKLRKGGISKKERTTLRKELDRFVNISYGRDEDTDYLRTFTEQRQTRNDAMEKFLQAYIKENVPDNSPPSAYRDANKDARDALSDMHAGKSLKSITTKEIITATEQLKQPKQPTARVFGVQILSSPSDTMEPALN